jgi:hypothetical protein
MLNKFCYLSSHQASQEVHRPNQPVLKFEEHHPIGFIAPSLCQHVKLFTQKPDSATSCNISVLKCANLRHVFFLSFVSLFPSLMNIIKMD